MLQHMDSYYGSDLAWVHHSGYSQHVENTAQGIVRLLRESGLSKEARVLDVGCGSGLLARRLLDAEFVVKGIDASPAMIDLARSYASGADFRVVRLPTNSSDRGAMLPETDAIVSTGHVLNYLDSREDIARTLGELARALRPGGVIAIDLMTEQYPQKRDLQAVYAKVTDDWAIVTRFSCPGPYRFDREITVFRRAGDHWRRSDEHHRNVTIDPEDALRILRDNGIEARQRTAFGEETLPEGLIVLAGVRRG